MEIATFGDDFDVAGVAAAGGRQLPRHRPGSGSRAACFVAKVAQHVGVVLQPAGDDVDHVAVGVALDDAVDAISRAPITILRCFSNTSGQMTRLAMPVSSSMVMKHDALGAARPLADQHQPGHRQALAVTDGASARSAVTNFCAA